MSFTYKRALGIAVALALAVPAIGCGSEDETEAVEERSAEYLRASAESDPELCDLISEAELMKLELVANAASEDGESQNCEQIIRGGEMFEDRAESLERQADEIDEAEVEVEDQFALVRFEDAGDELEGPLTLLLIREQGEWKVDDAQ